MFLLYQSLEKKDNQNEENEDEEKEAEEEEEVFEEEDEEVSLTIMLNFSLDYGIYQCITQAFLEGFSSLSNLIFVSVQIIKFIMYCNEYIDHFNRLTSAQILSCFNFTLVN